MFWFWVGVLCSGSRRRLSLVNSAGVVIQDTTQTQARVFPELGNWSMFLSLALLVILVLYLPPLLIMSLSWNNGKSGALLDLTSSTTPGLQIHTVDRTANPCDWLPCRHAALPLVGCPHSLVYLHFPVVEGLIFCISATPHLGTSFPLFHASSPQ